jgi:hypothetical protein
VIVVDASKRWGWKLGPSAHMLSTLPGAEGTRELLAFARQLKLKRQWLQSGGTAAEHFDPTRRRHEEALRLGAKLVTSRDLVRFIRAKRQAVAA